MSSLSISKVFSVSEDYTLEQLKKSYVEIMKKLYDSDMTQIEKDLLSNQYKKMYYKGKQLYLDRISMESDIEYPTHNYTLNNTELYDKFDRMFDNSFGLGRNYIRTYNPFSMYENIFSQLDSQFNHKTNTNNNSQVYSYSSSYSSKTNSDGSKTIVEHKSESTNGDKKKTINTYKKMPNGQVINLTEDEIKQLEKMSNLQIEN